MLVVVALLDAHQLILEWGIGDAHVDDSPAVVVRKVQAFTHLGVRWNSSRCLSPCREPQRRALHPTLALLQPPGSLRKIQTNIR